MKTICSRWRATLLAAGALSASAAEKGTLVAEMTSANVSKSDTVTVETVPVSGQPFKECLRVTVPSASKNSWDLRLRAPSSGGFQLGDIGILEFWARKVSGVGKIECLFERNVEPHNKFALSTVILTPEWKHYRVAWQHMPSWGPSRKDSYKGGEAQLGVNLGYGKQVVEIAGLRAVNYGPDIPSSELNLTERTYPGREADAPWRKAAAERIEKLRKGDFQLTLTGPDGKPLSGVPVKVSLKRHDFAFGSCINLYVFHREGADTERYRKEFARLFNQAVFEGAMKWNNGWEYSQKLQECLDFLDDNGITVRGHTLIWPGWVNLPNWLPLLQENKSALTQVVRDHIYYEASMLKDRVVDFDVMNESIGNHDLQDILGRRIMTDWYKTAREAAPGVKLYMNDTGILTFGTIADVKTNPKTIEYLTTIREMLAEGAPIDGIGLQGHFDESRLTPPEDLLATLDLFGEFKLPLKITEFDLKTFDEKLEADYLRDVMTVIFSHPQGAGFLMWGFWNGSHWKFAAPIFRKDWSLKPAGEAYQKLLFDTWNTKLDGNTGADGSFTGRGFYGQYDVEAEVGGKTLRGTFHLSPDGKNHLTVPVR